METLVSCLLLVVGAGCLFVLFRNPNTGPLKRTNVGLLLVLGTLSISAALARLTSPLLIKFENWGNAPEAMNVFAICLFLVIGTVFMVKLNKKVGTCLQHREFLLYALLILVSYGGVALLMLPKVMMLAKYVM